MRTVLSANLRLKSVITCSVSAMLAICVLSGCGDRKNSTPLKTAPTDPIVELPAEQPSTPDAPTNSAEPTSPVARQPTPTQQGSSSAPSVPPVQKNPVHPTQQCAPHADGSFTADYQMQDGNQGQYDWGQGGGCLLRPIRDAWATSLNQPLMVWGGVDESSAARLAPTPGLTHLYDIYYGVKRVGVTVASWHMNWYHSVQRGTYQAPEVILINYHRSSGTSHIPYWEGSIRLERVTDTVTSFVMRNQIHADRTGPADSGSTVTDVFNKLSSGQPDWTQL